jgi:putative oxidoreductase
MSLVRQVNDKVVRIRQQSAWAAPTFLRLVIGVVFVNTGWQHLHNLKDLTDNFVGWGIPLPGFNATLSSVTELVCGAAILLGIFTRLAALPLVVTMIVAIISAQRGQFSDVSDPWDFVVTLVNLVEFVYIAMLVSLAVIGSGPISVDRLIEKTLLRRHHAAESEATKP